MEERGSAQQTAHMEKGALGVGMSRGDRQNIQIECSPNRFQPQDDMEDMEVRKKEKGGSRLSRRASLDGLPSGGPNSEGQNLEMDKMEMGPRLEGGTEDVQRQTQGPRTRRPSPQIPSRAPSRGEAGQWWDSAEELPSQSIAGMLRALSLEVRGGFGTSNNNQKNLRGLCETLGEKIDDLAGRTAALEEEVGELKFAMEANKVEIQKLKSNEESVLSKLESLENNQRRCNLRFLRVPEGMEGSDLKELIIRLIKHGVQIEDTAEDIARDIRRAYILGSLEKFQRDISPGKYWLVFVRRHLRSVYWQRR
ncbi:hypothetical protein NDU88_009685 [Pleurodeles waltl]|uniref:Uncharacterized protein n=1 Tax=Pleurodeles waltl TaxID=8319 RepID=A0AAV7QSB0_PLEWA|nr:hypothetical protein NDU88_009685 [Pleurodeles waltl]